MKSRQRRSFSAEMKARIALEAIKEQKTIQEIASHYGVHPSQVTNGSDKRFREPGTVCGSAVAASMTFGLLFPLRLRRSKFCPPRFRRLPNLRSRSGRQDVLSYGL
jgi:hypothetical protein